MSTDGSAGLLELTANQPLGQPLQLTVTQEAAGVQITEENHNTSITENASKLRYSNIQIYLSIQTNIYYAKCIDTENT